MAQGKYVEVLVALFIYFIGAVMITFSSSGKLFLLEFFLTAIFMLVALISLFGIYFDESWGYFIGFILFAAGIGNMLILGQFVPNHFPYIAIVVISNLLGFFICISGFRINDYSADLKEEYKQVQPEKVPEVQVVYDPGKYIASSSRKKYHIPKCDWAKKISEKRQVWFDDNKTAEKKGYKACYCVK